MDSLPLHFYDCRINVHKNAQTDAQQHITLEIVWIRATIVVEDALKSHRVHPETKN